MKSRCLPKSAERVPCAAFTTILVAIHAAQSSLSMRRPSVSLRKREFTCGAPLRSQVQCQATGSRSIAPTTGRARTAWYGIVRAKSNASSATKVTS